MNVQCCGKYVYPDGGNVVRDVVLRVALTILINALYLNMQAPQKCEKGIVGRYASHHPSQGTHKIAHAHLFTFSLDSLTASTPE